MQLISKQGAAVLLFFILSLFHANGQDVRLKLNRPDGLYSKGDTVRVLACCPDSPDSLEMEIRVGGKTREKRSVCPGSAYYKEIYAEVCDSAKWVAVIVNTRDDRQIDIGWLVNPESFRPGYKAPCNLKQFWKKEISRMRKNAMTVKIDSVRAPEKYIGQVTCWHVQLSMHEGFPVNAYVCMPLGADVRTLPIRIQTHGATEITENRTQSQLKTACRTALSGTIGVDINAHGMEDGAPEEYYQELADGLLKDYSDQPLKDRESWYFRLMYLRLVRLVDYLVTLPQWDGRNIMVAGHSQGGGQALALGGIDPRITHVYADEPALCDHGGILLNRYGGWPFSTRRQNVPASKQGRKILPYYDGALLAGMFRGKLYLRAGLVDYTCPPTAVWTVYNNAGTEDKVIQSFRSRHHTNVVWYDKDELDALSEGFPNIEWLPVDEAR